MLPKIPYKMSKNKRQTTSFRGINYSNVTSEGDIADSKNISARAYPYLTTRRGRKLDYRLSGEKSENLNAVTEFGGNLVAISGGKLYYGGIEIEGKLEDGEKKFAAVNTKLCIMPDKKYFDLQTMTLEDMGAKVYAQASFPSATETDSGKTNAITLVSEKMLVAKGHGLFTDSSNNATGTYLNTTIVEKKPVAFLGQWIYLCEEIGPGTMTVKVDGSDENWIASVSLDGGRNWNVDSNEDIIFLSDGAAYRIGENGQARRWHKETDTWVSYVPESSSKSSPFKGQAFKHSDVIIYKAINMDYYTELKPMQRAGTILVTEGDFYNEIIGVANIEGYSDVLCGITKEILKRQGLIPNATITTAGWDKDTNLTDVLKAGDEVTINADGRAVVTATVSGVSATAISFENNTPLAKIEAMDPFAEIEILKTETTKDFMSVFKKGDGVTITGDMNNQENDLSFVISDIVDNTLYASSDIFTAGSQNVIIERKIPDMDYICESGNRLWGCSNKDNTIYVSALGDPTNFFVNDSISTDSFAVAVGSEGKFTACCRYGSDVLFWKETKLHKVIGSYPAEYTIYSYDIEGVQEGCEKSLAVINEVLYYKGIHGVYAFTSSPTLISSNFGERYFTDAVAVADGDSYYLSVKGDDGRSYLFVYETLPGLWILEDDVRVLDFVREGKDLYMHTDDGNFYLCGASDTQTDMEWFVQLTPFYETLEGSKTYSRLLLRVELPKGSYLRVEIRVDGGAWREAGKIIGRSYEVVPIRIPINRCDKFEIRLRGKGKCTVLSMMREFYVSPHNR